MGQDSIVLLICITVFLSYLPEAGQYSSFFLYLRQVKSYRPWGTFLPLSRAFITKISNLESGDSRDFLHAYFVNGLLAFTSCGECFVPRTRIC